MKAIRVIAPIAVFLALLVAFLALGALQPTATSGAVSKMYWVDSGTDKLQRANLDGTSVQDVVTGLVEPRGIEIDFGGGKIYWVDRGTQMIQRANLDGTSVHNLVTSGLSLP